MIPYFKKQIASFFGLFSVSTLAQLAFIVYLNAQHAARVPGQCRGGGVGLAAHRNGGVHFRTTPFYPLPPALLPLISYHPAYIPILIPTAL